MFTLKRRRAVPANLTLGAAISTSYQSFSGAAVPNGATFPYTAYTSTEFECGMGSYNTSGTLLVRTAGNVAAGSAGAGSLVSFASNPRVFIGPLAWDNSGQSQRYSTAAARH